MESFFFCSFKYAKITAVITVFSGRIYYISTDPVYVTALGHTFRVMQRRDICEC